VGPGGHVLAVDRSRRAIDQLERAGSELIAAGRLSTRCCPAEELSLNPGEEPYDLAFAVRVGALDGRHPATGALVLARLAEVLRPGGRLLVDGGTPLRAITIPSTGTGDA
jgi:SAM-dependent methyltransferase